MAFTEVDKGRSALVTIGQILNAAGTAYDLTGSLLRFMVKLGHEQTDADAIIDYRLSTDNTGISTSTAKTGLTGSLQRGRPDPLNPDSIIDTAVTSGYAYFLMTNADTNLLPTGSGTLPWEVAIVPPGSGKAHTLRSGEIAINNTLIDNPGTIV